MSDNNRPFGPGSFPATSAPLDADLVSVNVLADPARRSRPFSWGKIRSTLLEFLSPRVFAPLAGGLLRILENASFPEWYDASRKATITILNNVPTTYDKVGIYVETLQDSNAGQISLTGIQSVTFTEPDNGGDVSAFLGLSTGGGPAATFVRDHTVRPAGASDYSLTSTQPALEVQTTCASSAILAIAGRGASPRRGTAITASTANTSDCFAATPVNNTFDERYGFYCGSPQLNDVPLNIKASITLAGDFFGKSFSFADGVKFVGYKTGAGAPTVTQLPNSGDFGLVTNTTDGKLYLAFNLSGVFKKVELT